MPLTPSIFPPGFDTTSFGNELQYDDLITLSMPWYGDLLLSGGSIVRTNTQTIGVDEQWQVGSFPAGKTGAVYYGDTVLFSLPQHGFILLSGGPAGVRTNTTVPGVDEQWQIISDAYQASQQRAVLFGDPISLQMPQHRSLLLSGGGSVRTSVTVIQQDEMWRITACNP